MKAANIQRYRQQNQNNKRRAKRRAELADSSFGERSRGKNPKLRTFGGGLARIIHGTRKIDDILSNQA
jgi:hypothetical protein